MRAARGAVEAELLSEGDVPQERDLGFAVDFAHLDLARDDRAVAGVEEGALLGQRVRISLHVVVAILGADGHAERTVGEIEQRAGDVGRGHVFGGDVGLEPFAGHVILGRLEVRPLGEAERIERHAGGIVVGRRSVGVDAADRLPVHARRVESAGDVRGDRVVGQIAAEFVVAVLVIEVRRPASADGVFGRSDHAEEVVLHRDLRRSDVAEPLAQREAGRAAVRENGRDIERRIARPRDERVVRLDGDGRVAIAGAAVTAGAPAHVDSDLQGKVRRGIPGQIAHRAVALGRRDDREIEVGIVLGGAAALAAGHPDRVDQRAELEAPGGPVGVEGYAVDRPQDRDVTPDIGARRGRGDAIEVGAPGVGVGQDVAGRDGRHLARRKRIAPDDDQAVGAPVALAAVLDAVGLLPFAADDEVKVGTELPAGGGAELAREVVAGVGDADFAVDLVAGELLVDQQVDHAGHRVRSVNGRCAAGDDFGARQQDGRHHVGVDGRLGRGRHEPLAVDQGQRPDGAEAAQVEDAPADVLPRAGVEAGGGGRLGGAERGQFVQRVADVGKPAILEPLRSENGHGCRPVEVRLDAGPGDDDRILFGAERRGGSAFGLRCRAGLRLRVCILGAGGAVTHRRRRDGQCPNRDSRTFDGVQHRLLSPHDEPFAGLHLSIWGRLRVVYRE